MAHTYTANFVHCVFSTKNRLTLIPDKLEEQLWAYILGIANNLKLKTLAVGGTGDHVHVLVGIPTNLTVAEAVQKLKANSSRWLGENGISFQWQEGYGAFSVSPSMLATVQKYIRSQKEHHRRRSFEEELRALLDRAECHTILRGSLRDECRHSRYVAISTRHLRAGLMNIVAERLGFVSSRIIAAHYPR
jgi:putative transposase